MKKIIFSIVIFYCAMSFGQVNELIIEDGTEFNIPLGAQVATDIIIVKMNAIFISEDPSGIAEGTTINDNGGSNLPVEINSFTAKVNNDEVMLSWVTLSEINNCVFEVQRSKSLNEKSEWETIGFVNGLCNSNSSKQYSFIDRNLVGGSKFKYRLKQIGNSGAYKFSNIIEVAVIPNQFELFQNYPNPFNPSTKIRYQLPKSGLVSIKVYNILGAQVAEIVNEVKEAGSYEVEFVADNLPSATYVYRLTTESFSDSKKMILLK